MQCLIERGARCLFYAATGFSMVIVTTPSLANAFTGSQAVHLWPLIGLLAYLLHLFEDTGKPASAAGNRERRRAGDSFGPVFPGGRPSSLPAGRG